ILRSYSFSSFSFFFFNPPSTTDIYTLSLHDALPISQYHYACGIVAARRGLLLGDGSVLLRRCDSFPGDCAHGRRSRHRLLRPCRSEEHTSELQSQSNLVCRLLLEKKKQKK